MSNRPSYAPRPTSRHHRFTGYTDYPPSFASAPFPNPYQPNPLPRPPPPPAPETPAPSTSPNPHQTPCLRISSGYSLFALYLLLAMLADHDIPDAQLAGGTLLATLWAGVQLWWTS
ncbi:hypothetical protein LTR08_003572 [Meristemomyces frigidus]|nr:hypothetical protein LTR08_003572 [Meristemomyces frigidus]